MRVHLVGLPHTQLTDWYATCAYTQKVRRFIRMMHPDPETYYGRECEIHYYGPGSGAHRAVASWTTTITDDEQAEWFGEWNPDVSPDVDWNPERPWWQQHNRLAVESIAEHWSDGDLLLLSAGLSQKPIWDALPQARGVTVEPFVGYSGVIGEPWRFYESQAWAHYVMGMREEDGRWFDAVVPNYFDPADFPVGEGGGGYLAWMGRWDSRKGQRVALDIAERTGMDLRLAGPGYDGSDLPDRVEHVGTLGPADRAKFLGDAVALLAPTEYVEPFGGVAVEAMLCGTPAITTAWGAFTETVPVFWQFHTLAEGCGIVDRFRGQPGARKIASLQAEHYTLDAVRPQMLVALERVASLWGEGWTA